MPGHDLFSLVTPSAAPPSWPIGYVGPGPGAELIPYFLALLALVGAALGAVLRWPIATLRRVFSGARDEHQCDPDEPRHDGA